jgi:hypothetical protein
VGSNIKARPFRAIAIIAKHSCAAGTGAPLDRRHCDGAP